jgi:hypothetical protein
MFSSRRWYALLLLPLAGAAGIFAALLRVWDMWFLNHPAFAAVWTIGGLIPYLLSFLGILGAVRASASALGVASAVAGGFLILPGLGLAATFGEGTLILLTFLPLYTWGVIIIALLAAGAWSALAMKRKNEGSQ